MTNMLRISDAASLAMHTMAVLARDPERMMSTHEIAQSLSVSENHLAKVRQRLAKAGLVDATRGPHGGFRLAGNPRDITLLKVYEAIEGEFRPGNCLLGKPACDGRNCILGGLVETVNTKVLEYLSRTTLADLAAATRPA